MTEKEYPGGIIVVDYGQPEYLDGARMQFRVTDRLRTCAYFACKSDAELFAKARAAGLKA